MPFIKRWDHYVSPSGKKFTKVQVKMYYTTDWFKNIKKRLLSNRTKWMK